MTSYRIWMYKQVVNVLPLSDNHARGYSLMRSRRETGLCGSTESAAGSSLSRFQGRCLLVGAGPVWHRQPFAAVVGNTRVDRLRITTQRRFDSAGVHQQAPFCRQGAATQRSGHASAPPEKTGTPHTRSRKADPAYPSGTGQVGASMVRQAPHRLNDGLQGLWAVLVVVCASRERDESIRYSPLGN